jgi:drug/metabolite transporter (DMT)-like permease
MKPPSVARPLDAIGATVVVLLCLSWGFNQVAVKLALPEIPPFTQAALRSVGAAVLVALWCRVRGIPLLDRDGTLLPGLVAGALFGLEFLLIYPGLVYTTATRAVLFIYLAPFFVVAGARFVLPGDRFNATQWAGLALSFSGMLLAFGVPTPALDPRQALGDLMMVGAAAAWALTTLVIKASALNRVSAEKTMLYQLVVSLPMLALGAWIFGERMTAWPSGVALGSLAYQTVWIVSITFVLWFAMIVRYSASRVSAFTFLTPLFGVVAGYLVLNEPINWAFAGAVALVIAGLVVVNRPR